MEKQTKILVGGIQKFSTEDGPGIRTTVFLKGCPLNCKWCHNPELIEYGQQLIRMSNNCIGCGYCIKECPKGALYPGEDGKVAVDHEKCDNCMKCTEMCYARSLQPVAEEMTIDEILYEAEQDKGFYEHTGGGITVSGGEMLSHHEFVSELADAAAERGIDLCLDTSGFGDGDALEMLAAKSNVTTILYDMKAIESDVHEEYTGRSNAVILENLRRLAANPLTSEKIQMRMPLIKGINDSEEMIRKTGEFYKANSLKKLTLLPYHNLGISKEKNIGGIQMEFEPPTDERVQEIFDFFKDEIGMDVEILGKL